MMKPECKEGYKIIFGEGCIVHPTAQIRAECGDIFFGDYNIVEEQVVITNRGKNEDGTHTPVALVIENSNYFGSGSHIDTCKIGNANVFEPKSLVGYGTEVGNNCTVKAGE